MAIQLQRARGLEMVGILRSGPVHWNLSIPALYEAAVRRGEGLLAVDGPMVCNTGHHTGRSPNDKFFVREAESEKHIHWGDVNRALDATKFDALHRDLVSYVQDKELFVLDAWAGADPEYRLPVRIVTEFAWHNLFVRNMFLPENDPVKRAEHVPHVMEEATGGAASVFREADRVLLSRYAPSGVLINDNMEILQFRGHVSPYVEPRSGAASLNLLRLAREGLTLDLKAAEAAYREATRRHPQAADAWNNLANHYSHSGPLSKAFEYFAKAIELNPDKAVYYQNFANTVGFFRKDAMEFYGIDEQGVFRKALDLYRQGLKLDSTNFTLASDLAQIYYGIKPVRTEEAIAAWEYAQKIAPGAFEREGVHLHLARFKLNAERFEEARRHVTNVTNAAYLELKQRLLHNLEQQQNQARQTNAPPSGSGKKP